MNIFDLSGPDFLGFYVVALVGAGVLAVAVRGVLWFVLGSHEADGMHTLDPYETAYLAGGERHAMNAALASLIQRSVLSVNGVSRTVTTHKLGGGNGHPFEKDLCHSVSSVGTTLQGLHDRDFASLDAIRKRLEQLGLVFSPTATGLIRFLLVLPLVLVTGIGAIKIFVGLSREKPVIFLVVLTALAAFAVVKLLRWQILRTPAGNRMLKSLQSANAALQTTSATKHAKLSGEDVALSLALFGTGVLVGPSLAGLQTALMPSTTTNSGWGGWFNSSCGSSGCSSGSCGSSCGGGCGGGGCGGCGGD